MRSVFLFVFAIWLCQACSSNDIIDKPKSTSINKIMILGASRVEGNRPEYESFRYELWKTLKENNWEFDFIGTQSDEADYPDFNGESFDVDHEGRGGWTSGAISADLDWWLEHTAAPDIVLFSSPAGNDALEGLAYNEAIDNINEIIDILQAHNPNVTILIEQLAPGKTEIMTEELNTYMVQLQQDVVSIAAQQTSATSAVIAIDMYTGFTDQMLADDVHYNETGAAFIAEKYYSVLEGILE